MISTYNQICPVLFGAGAVNQLADKAKELGGTKALCIYDQGVKMTGMADRMIKLLADAGIEVVSFDRVLPDAPDTVINEVGKIAQDEKVDIVIGIGGGSTLDTAKAAAILVDNPLPIGLYYAAKGAPQINKTPLILIPTASGTGSEVTIMSVLHDHDTHSKNAVLRAAIIAIVDPELTLTLPAHITAASGLDALSHAIESYTTNCGNPKAEVLSLAAVTLIADNLEKAYKDGSDIEARTNMSFASNIAGMSFTEASVHFGHAAAHEFGIIYNMQHGIACAITLPEVITFSADVIPEKTIKIAEALGVKLPESVTGVEAGELAAGRVRQMMKTLGIKSLKEQGISREDAVACAEGAVAKNWFIVCTVKPVDVTVMGELIGKMYDNYL